MRTRRDYSSFPIEYQIKKLNTKIKFMKIFTLFLNVLIIVISIMIWIYTLERDFSIALLISVPFSILGGYIQIKEYKKEIEKLKEKNVND